MQIWDWDLRKKPKPEYLFPHSESVWVGSMHTYVCSVVITKQIYYKPANICGRF